jgi:hypothetical protein
MGSEAVARGEFIIEVDGAVANGLILNGAVPLGPSRWACRERRAALQRPGHGTDCGRLRKGTWTQGCPQRDNEPSAVSSGLAQEEGHQFVAPLVPIGGLAGGGLSITPLRRRQSESGHRPRHIASTMSPRSEGRRMVG